MTPITWHEVAQLPLGTRVRFVQDWDIFPHCVVPAGTIAIVRGEADHGSYWFCRLFPENAPQVAKALVEWQGEIQLTPFDGHADVGDTWSEPSPLKLVREVASAT